MTVIAWDGKTLAADKAATICGHAHTVTKIYRIPDGLVGFSGNGGGAMALLEWFRNGRKIADWPKYQDKDDTSAGAMFIDREGRQFNYGSTPFPEPVEDRFGAMGAGRDYALAAMHLGCDACRAIEVACALDVTCGNGIDTLGLDHDNL